MATSETQTDCGIYPTHASAWNLFSYPFLIVTRLWHGPSKEPALASARHWTLSDFQNFRPMQDPTAGLNFLLFS